MFDLLKKIVDGMIQGFLQLLPDHGVSNKTWISRVVTLFIIYFFVISIGFIAIRESPLGVRWGINSPPPRQNLTNREYRDISTVLYSYLIRIKEEVPALRTAFFIAVFDERGNINWADENPERIGIFTWYTPNARFFSFNAVEDVIRLSKKAHFADLAIKKECVSGRIEGVNLQRYKEAIPSFLSNRYVVCPVPKKTNRYPFGAVLTYWVDNPRSPNLEQEMLTSAKQNADQIGRYLQSREDLELNR
ncbi:MAG: hypothetical protein ACRDBG_21735 [Waterburya sp.]